ncbi:MAG: glycine--tRNA ligase subunit beta [Sphingomonas sp.]|uniref:glycine--tRNA ligase subunit beta n=1 Tax=Sphingomonas sp. TaxID=28214 RepID=UPI0025E51FDD|nr:glycine--tRNA ligase subunit beta [Sphingomonas sp.]MBY0282896.1 glycine--tRNA ligase subunit beta [Sphingomonas sp.]
MSDFLLELRSEEIPARMQAKAREELAKLFVAELAKGGITASDIITYATPRRLALIARRLPMQTAAVSEETKGPKTGAPPQALEGFLRKTGLTQDQLVERDGVYFAVIEKPGRATADVLAEAIPAIIRAFPWPKSMRWGAASLSTESLRWVRPLQGIVALLDGVPVPCEVAGIASGRNTLGHRFMSSGPISIDSAASYVDQLRDGHVIVDQDERANIIALGAKMAARKAGLTLIEDAGLLAENAGLTEWPVPLLGRFDEAFLSVPPEVIQLTARVNQKYFVCTDGAGKLANAFICTANIDAEDGGERIVEGNRKVLAARLSDAAHFFEEDQWHHDPVTRQRTDRKTLDEHATRLADIVFHEKLGTVADKVDRVAKLARWLCEEEIIKPLPFRGGVGVGTVPTTQAFGETDTPHPNPSPEGEGLSKQQLADLAERAARLCKADLVTGMVGEFPELQGLMGGYYAAAQGKALGEDPRVAAAIRDHYKPVGQGDDVPTDPVTVAVSLADKLDTLISFFFIDEAPTGSKDPFALRRATLAVNQITATNNLRFSISRIMKAAGALLVFRAWLANQRDPRFRSILDIAWPAFPEWEDMDAVDKRLAQIWAEPQTIEAAFVRSMRSILQEERDRHALMSDIAETMPRYFADRLKVQQREAGVRHDLIDAVFALGGEDDLVRLLARVRALQAFIGTEDGANLLAGYKRAANILKKEGVASTPTVTPAAVPGSTAPPATASEGAPWAPEQVRGDDGAGEGAITTALPYTPEPAEAALIAALDVAAPAAAAAVAAEDFEAAMAALAQLRAPIDAFFERVTVNDPDPAKRAARLSLLEKVRDAVHGVADFSKIEG